MPKEHIGFINLNIPKSFEPWSSNIAKFLKQQGLITKIINLSTKIKTKLYTTLNILT